MSDLEARINEMIDILHEIDPAAAAKFRGGAMDQTAVRAEIIEPKNTVQSMPAVRKTKVRSIKKSLESNADRRLRSSEPLSGLTAIGQNPERLVEAIVFSEIIGRPLSQRNGRRRY
jgi:hypothetical protein